MNVFMDEQEQNLKGSQLHVCLSLKDTTEMILLSNFCCWSLLLFFLTFQIMWRVGKILHPLLLTP